MELIRNTHLLLKVFINDIQCGWRLVAKVLGGHSDSVHIITRTDLIRVMVVSAMGGYLLFGAGVLLRMLTNWVIL